MKKLLLLSFLLLCIGIKSYSQVLWSENFNTGSTIQMILNSIDVVNGRTTVQASDWNSWTINDSYMGGTVNIVSIPCPSGGTIGGTILTTPSEPQGVSGANSADSFRTYYLHIHSPIYGANAIPVTNASWCYAADSLAAICPPSETYFVKMSSGISTIGKSNVYLRYYWACGGVTTYGQSYYSIDSGATWVKLVGSYSNQTTWKLDSIHLAAFDSVPDLRFGFLWVSPYVGSTPSGSDPAFSLDDISIGIPFPAGINNISLDDKIHAYPDPFTNQIRLSSTIASTDIQNIEIYDVLGRMVLQQKPDASNQSSLQIDASALQQGAYFLRIITKEGIYTKSLIKE